MGEVINISSGKGGVGKTTIVYSMALDLAESNNKILILDADLELANVNICFGKPVKKTLSNFVNSECSLRDTIVKVSDGIDLIPSASASKKLINLNPKQINGIKNALNTVKNAYDYVLIDSASGVGNIVSSFIDSSTRVVIVVNDDILSITDSFALIKRMHLDQKTKTVEIVTNKMSKIRSKAVYFKIQRALNSFFPEVIVSKIGNIEYYGSKSRRVETKTISAKIMKGELVMGRSMR